MCLAQAGRGALVSHRTLPIGKRSSRLRLPKIRFTTARDTATALNIEVMIPRQCTTANPRTGPDPNRNRAMPAISVVMFESRIVAHARSYPAVIAACGVVPPRSSSRTRSLMSTLASIAIPSVSAMAAIPGRVSVACSMDSNATSSIRFTASAITETTPNKL